MHFTHSAPVGKPRWRHRPIYRVPQPWPVAATCTANSFLRSVGARKSDSWYPPPIIQHLRSNCRVTLHIPRYNLYHFFFVFTRIETQLDFKTLYSGIILLSTSNRPLTRSLSSSCREVSAISRACLHREIVSFSFCLAWLHCIVARVTQSHESRAPST